MKLLLMAVLLFTTNASADPLKKVLKRSDYCSPLQKLTGGCKKKNKNKEETQMESDSKKSNPKSKKKKAEEPEEFLR